jgi:hypothetical protein
MILRTKLIIGGRCLNTEYDYYDHPFELGPSPKDWYLETRPPQPSRHDDLTIKSQKDRFHRLDRTAGDGYQP